MAKHKFHQEKKVKSTAHGCSACLQTDEAMVVAWAVHHLLLSVAHGLVPIVESWKWDPFRQELESEICRSTLHMLVDKRCGSQTMGKG